MSIRLEMPLYKDITIRSISPLAALGTTYVNIFQSGKWHSWHGFAYAFLNAPVHLASWSPPTADPMVLSYQSRLIQNFGLGKPFAKPSSKFTSLHRDGCAIC